MGLLVLLFPVPVSLQQVTTNPYLCRRPSDTCRQVWFSLLWGHCSFPVVPGARKVLFVPPRSICLPSPCGCSVIKFTDLQSWILWLLPVPLLDPQVKKSDMGPRAFATVQETSLLVLFFSLWVTLTVHMRLEFNVIAPLSFVATSPLSLESDLSLFLFCR